MIWLVTYPSVDDWEDPRLFQINSLAEAGMWRVFEGVLLSYDAPPRKILIFPPYHAEEMARISDGGGEGGCKKKAKTKRDEKKT